MLEGAPRLQTERGPLAGVVADGLLDGVRRVQPYRLDADLLVIRDVSGAGEGPDQLGCLGPFSGFPRDDIDNEAVAVGIGAREHGRGVVAAAKGLDEGQGAVLEAVIRIEARPDSVSRAEEALQESFEGQLLLMLYLRHEPLLHRCARSSRA